MAETLITFIAGGLLGVWIRAARARREALDAFHGGYVLGATTTLNELGTVVELSEDELAAIERLRQQRKDAPWN